MLIKEFQVCQVNPGEWVIAGATIFCGVLLNEMNLLIRSNIKQSEKQIQDINIDVTLLKVYIKDIKLDRMIMKSDFSNIKGDLITTFNWFYKSNSAQSQDSSILTIFLSSRLK